MNFRIIYNLTILFFLTWMKGAHAYSRNPSGDTLDCTIGQVEQIFLRRNLQLLAEKYQINMASAQILQERLINNPTISISQGGYNPLDGTWFSLGYHGETAVGIQQEVQLAGKRNKAIRMALIRSRLSVYQFNELLKTLNYSLRTDFFKLYFLFRSSSVYSEEISSLQQVVHAFEKPGVQGYISEQELVRMQALLYDLQFEYTDLGNKINDLEGELRVLLRREDTLIINPRVDEKELLLLRPTAYSINLLIDTALSCRPDLEIRESNLELSRENFEYQKSLSVPDISLGLGFDKNGSYIHDANFLSLSIDLPFFNRNQGNILTAKNLIGYYSTQLEDYRNLVREQVMNAVKDAINLDQVFHGIDPKYQGDFNRLSRNVLLNYQKRNIGLLDFIDFFDSFKNTSLEMDRIGSERMVAFERINYYTGKDFFY